ncbi:MAG: phosphate ABC transporter permease subunit PstC [Hyphomonas sp.]
MFQQLGHLPMGWLMFALLAMLASGAFFVGRVQAERFSDATASRLHSRPNYHGYFVAMWTLGPALAVALGYGLLGEPIVRSILVSELPANFQKMPDVELGVYLDAVTRAAIQGGYSGGDRVFSAITSRFLEIEGLVKLCTIGLALLGAAVGFLLARRRIVPSFRARNSVEKGLEILLFLCAAIAIATTVGIIASLLYESLRFFAEIPFWDFLFGTRWNAQTSAEFGALPLFFGTFMIALIAMLIAAPVGLFAAIYLSEYAGPKVRAWVKPILEILAGIPTVVYGFFALLVVAPAIRSLAIWVNTTLMSAGLTAEPLLAAQPTSALAAGLVMGIMVIPFVSSLSDDVINAVPQTLRDAAYAMGATKSETVKHVVLPAALPGIIASLLLAVSRAIGETMIVVMAAGQRARISADPTADLTTITVQIVALLTGETEFDSPKTLSAFALGLVLFAVTLVFNLIALRVVQKYREKYD